MYMHNAYIYMHCTTEEGDRVVENFGYVVIVIIKFVDQDIIAFSSCFICIYIYIYYATCAHRVRSAGHKYVDNEA